ncbi:MAG TPA: hypothetical protein VE690_11595 [Rhodopila sp.]|nr:hypothetical protein [Rhodopila sp.]
MTGVAPARSVWTVHRLAVIGWYGVQLFVLASAVTLMMSWQREAARAGAVDVGAFFLRRLFRIAPAYYAAGVLYFLLQPPSGAGDPGKVAAALLFLNAWHPVWMGVVPPGWSVVPGGWSIGVEFTSYAAFPVLALSRERISVFVNPAITFVGRVNVPAQMPPGGGFFCIRRAFEKNFSRPHPTFTARGPSI